MDFLYSVASGIDTFMNSGPPLLATLFYVCVVGIPITLLHEVGHAVTARDRLGTHVHIKVGKAGKIAQLRLGAISASINAFETPFGPAGSATFDATLATARDVFWIALSGPLASLIGGLFAVILYTAAPAHGLAHDVLWASVALSAGAAVFNLIPFELRERSGATFRSDGRLALDALKVARAMR